MESENGNSEVKKLNQVIVDMAVEAWRFGKVFERMLTRVNAGDQGRYQSQFQWFIKKMEESLGDIGLSIANIEGQSFDPGMAATALNIDQFDTADSLVIDQMIEPIIMGRDGLIKPGTVTLKKVVE